MDLVDVISNVNADVTLYAPSHNFKRRWSRKGAIQKIERTMIESVFYEPGVESMFRSGILYIKDKDLKIALGLEKPDEKENIVLMTDEYMDNLLTATPISEFKETVNSMSHDQVIELAHRAIDTNITDYHRDKLLMDLTGMEILNIVTDNLNHLEEDKASGLI